MTMPEVDVVRDYTHIPAKQIVNHLLALGVDVLTYRAGVDADWVDNEGLYESKFIKESHQRAKAMLQYKGSRVTSNTHVIFARMWSDGFKAFQIKGKNDSNSL